MTEEELNRKIDYRIAKSNSEIFESVSKSLYDQYLSENDDRVKIVLLGVSNSLMRESTAQQKEAIRIAKGLVKEFEERIRRPANGCFG